VAWTELRGHTDVHAMLEVNGRMIPIASDGGFVAPVSLRVGENTVSILASDSSGMNNLAHVAMNVTSHDPDGTSAVAPDADPELTLYLPPQGVVLKSPALTLAGHTHPGYLLAVNNDTVHVNRGGSFRAV
jgi:hypothetical protein